MGTEEWDCDRGGGMETERWNSDTHTQSGGWTPDLTQRCVRRRERQSRAMEGWKSLGLPA